MKIIRFLFASIVSAIVSTASKPTPIVIWHGMGDSCCDPRSIGTVIDYIKQNLPGVYVYSIQIGNTPDEDRKSSFFGNFNDQVAHVCDTLANDAELQQGFNAIGFSQGGQGLRAYIERCNSPQVKNLATFGSQHAGVADIPNCEGKSGWCSLMRSVVQRGVYVPSIQKRIIQAQYYKDPANYQEYLDRSDFLADINNEKDDKITEYADNMKKLENFIMILFEDDQMVVPKESAWFWFFNDDRTSVIPLKEQKLYTEDWIGLKSLNEQGKLHFKSSPGQHMQISLEFLRDEILLKYFEPESMQTNGLHNQEQ